MGKYCFIEYSRCRFRTTQALPGRTGEEVSLEESEEEAEGGEELLGKSPVEMLWGHCHTPGPFLLCHGELQKDTQKPPPWAKKIEVVWGAQEVTSAGASPRCVVAVGPGRDTTYGIPCRSSFPTSPSSSHLRRKELGSVKRWLRKRPHFFMLSHDLVSWHLCSISLRGSGGSGGESHITYGLEGEVRWGFLLSALHGGAPVHPKGWDKHWRKEPPPKSARPVSREKVEGVRKTDQQEECRSFHWLLHR